MDTLFDVEPVPVPPAGPKDSPGVRRTRGQAELLARGVHPLTGQGLHEQAAPADDRDALGRRCGNCRFRRVLDYHARAYPKCLFGATEDYAPVSLTATPLMPGGGGRGAGTTSPATRACPTACGGCRIRR